MAQIHEHRGRWQKYMKAFFILFVALHLLIDLAMPSLPGAFRFNPDESVVAVRVEPVPAQDLKPATWLDVRREFFELPRLETKLLRSRSPESSSSCFNGSDTLAESNSASLCSSSSSSGSRPARLGGTYVAVWECHVPVLWTGLPEGRG